MERVKSSTGGRRRFLALVVMVLVLAAFATPAFALPEDFFAGAPLYATMTGDQEAPNPGDPDGFGHAIFRLNQGQGLICYELHVSNIEEARAAHIHIAPPGVAGPVVVPLIAPATGFSSGCAEVDPELIKAIRQNPGAYYVNVHNAPFPGGAVRGQLVKPGQ
jgi:hypothetical protein